MTTPCLELAFNKPNVKGKVLRLEVQVSDIVPVCQTYMSSLYLKVSQHAESHVRWSWNGN